MQEGKKYIHYCWFGGAKLSRLAKKCIRSWKKYLPDYEIIRWDETNSSLDDCAFVKEAYESKKWAFVADYVRVKALYEYGGVYLDTDMRITKDIAFLLKQDSFLGVEDSGSIAVGVWGVKNPGNKTLKQLIDFYRKQKHFNKRDLYSITIPKIVTNILSKYGFKADVNETQQLDDGTVIYPREYFYPLSYNYHNNKFTKNTCMIHYYDASWAAPNERRTIFLIRKLGPKGATILLKIWGKFKALVTYYGKVLWRTVQILLFPIHFIYKRISKSNRFKFDEIIKKIKKLDNEYIAFTREGWLGVGSSTKDMFGEVFYLPEIENRRNLQEFVEAIRKNKKIHMIIFSGFADGWEWIVEALRKNCPDKKIKIFWHGSNAMHLEELDWSRFKAVFELLESGTIDQIAFAKKSMYEQYKKLGYNVEFLPNNIIIDDATKRRVRKTELSNRDGVKIGIYASGDRWVKNFYNQVAASSLIDNAEIDIIPITPRMVEFAKILKINLDGEEGHLQLEDLLARIAQNDIVLYATFVECAPILPLECLELGTICITGDNHHYWTGTPLEKYLIEPKVDNPVAIAKRIEFCLANKEKVLEAYRKWKKSYNKSCEQKIHKFLTET